MKQGPVGEYDDPNTQRQQKLQFCLGSRHHFHGRQPVDAPDPPEVLSLHLVILHLASHVCLQSHLHRRSFPDGCDMRSYSGSGYRPGLLQTESPDPGLYGQALDRHQIAAANVGVIKSANDFESIVLAQSPQVLGSDKATGVEIGQVDYIDTPSAVLS